MSDPFSRTFTEYLQSFSIEEPLEVDPVEQEPSWMDPLRAYLDDGTLPTDKEEAKRVRQSASRYIVLDEALYKRSFSQPLLKCLGPTDADYTLREIHEGIYGDHLRGRLLAYKVIRQGYYWSMIQKDAADFIRKCDSCQRYANIQRRPVVKLTPLIAPWPFAQWWMDIVGPFPPTTGQRKFLLVAVNYFTKWVEDEALAQIIEAKVEKFI